MSRTDYPRNREILRRSNGGETMTSIAADFGISAARVADVLRVTRSSIRAAPRRHKAKHLVRVKNVVEGAIGLARLRPVETAAVLAQVWAKFADDFDVVIRPDHDGIQAFMDSNPLVEEEPDGPA